MSENKTNKNMKTLELMDVEYTNENKKAILTFLDEERGEIREVNFNKQAYDSLANKYVDDAEKEQRVEEWSEQYFNLTFDTLAQAIGERKEVYCYDRFNSLWPASDVKKFDKSMQGQIINGEITEIIVDNVAIKIRFDYDGETYESKMTYAVYNTVRKEWFLNPIKKDKQFKKFEEKFHVPVDEKDNLVGQDIMVEVKTAFGSPYAEIKNLPKLKK